MKYNEVAFNISHQNYIKINRAEGDAKVYYV